MPTIAPSLMNVAMLPDDAFGPERDYLIGLDDYGDVLHYGLGIDLRGGRTVAATHATRGR